MKLIRITQHLATFFRVTPFVWNGNVEKIEVATARKAKFQWRLAQLFYSLHQVFVLARYVQSIMSGRHDFKMYVLQTCYFLLFFIVCVILATISVNTAEYIAFTNHEIRFFRSVEGKYLLNARTFKQLHICGCG